MKKHFICKGCNKSFKDNFNLKRHVNRKKPCTVEMSKEEMLGNAEIGPYEGMDNDELKELLSQRDEQIKLLSKQVEELKIQNIKKKMFDTTSMHGVTTIEKNLHTFVENGGDKITLKECVYPSVRIIDAPAQFLSSRIVFQHVNKEFNECLDFFVRTLIFNPSLPHNMIFCYNSPTKKNGMFVLDHISKKTFRLPAKVVKQAIVETLSEIFIDSFYVLLDHERSGRISLKPKEQENLRRLVCDNFSKDRSIRGRVSELLKTNRDAVKKMWASFGITDDDICNSPKLNNLNFANLR